MFAVNQPGHVSEHNLLASAPFNIQSYDAEGDGTTDDTAAVQSALDAAETAGGGIVLCPAGTYLISSTLSIANSVQLVGVGESAVIKQDDVTNLDALIANKAWIDNSSYVGAWTRISNIAFDGNKSNQTSGAGHGVIVHAYRAQVDGIGVSDTGGHGIYLAATTEDGTATLQATSVENRVLNNRLLDCDGSGIFVDTQASLYTDGFCHANVVGSPQGPSGGIYVGNGAGWSIGSNHIYSSAYEAIHVANANTTIFDNRIDTFGTTSDGATVRGIFVKAIPTRAAIVSNNDVHTSEPGTGNSYIGIHVRSESGSSQAIITGNVIVGEDNTDGILLNVGASATALESHDGFNAFAVGGTDRTTAGSVTRVATQP